MAPAQRTEGTAAGTRNDGELQEQRQAEVDFLGLGEEMDDVDIGRRLHLVLEDLVGLRVVRGCGGSSPTSPPDRARNAPRYGSDEREQPTAVRCAGTAGRHTASSPHTRPCAGTQDARTLYADSVDRALDTAPPGTTGVYRHRPERPARRTERGACGS